MPSFEIWRRTAGCPLLPGKAPDFIDERVAGPGNGNAIRSVQISSKSEVNAMQRRQVRFRTSHPDAPVVERLSDVLPLWITGPSVALKQRLMTFRGLPSTTIISPETECETEVLPAKTIEVIAGCVVRHGVCCVVVCGEADDVCSRSLADESPLHEPTSRYGRMLQRIVDRSVQRRRVQDRVRTWLKQIHSHERISTVSRGRSIRLIGMFYVPECDAFLVHDQPTDQFVPIMEALSRGCLDTDAFRVDSRIWK
jgi:hypothetical protein